MRLGFAGIIAVAIPALEIVGIYLIGSRIGLWPTLLWLLAAVIAGAYVIREERATFMPRLQQMLAQGHPPFGLLWASGRRFLAGVLLMLPGPFSDLIALPLLLWPGPKLPPPATEPNGPNDQNGPTTSGPKPRGAPGDVIEGEFRRED
jgi:UPF0716 protein FxsA